MNAISLYSGGCDGMGFAAGWAGIKTLAYCDNDAACRELLRSRNPNALIFHSDEEVTPDALQIHGIIPAAIDLLWMLCPRLWRQRN